LFAPWFGFWWWTILWWYNYAPYGSVSAYPAEPGPAVDVGVRHGVQQLADVARLSIKIVGDCAYVHTVRVVAQ
jgi:hypothetical protein